MAIIIDGYNVLHASRWLASDWKGVDRAQFCRLLGSLARHSGEKITVVFDALPSDPNIAPEKVSNKVHQDGRTQSPLFWGKLKHKVDPNVHSS